MIYVNICILPDYYHNSAVLLIKQQQYLESNTWAIEYKVSLALFKAKCS